MRLNPFRARRERQARETADAVLKGLDGLRAVLLGPVEIKIDGKTVATMQPKVPYVPSSDGDDGWTLPPERLS